jgi:hypothetical protein
MSSLHGNALRLLAFGCLCFMATAGLSQPRIEPAEPILRVVVRPAQDGFSLHEPVQAVLEILNGLDRSIHLDLGGNHKEDLTVSITRPDGKKVMGQLRQPFGNFSKIGRIDLAPQKIYSETLVLNEWESFDSVGTYVVEIAVPSPSESVNRAESELSGFGLIRVTPLDPIRLKSACEGLEAKALDGKPEQQMEAGIALSFAAEDVCVPSLAKLLSTKSSGKEGAILGLARLRTAPAIAALVDAWDGLDETSKIAVWSELNFTGNGETLRDALTRAGKKER